MPEMDVMTVDLPVDKLVARKDARKLEEKKIGEIRLSIEELGLINPLRVRPTRIETAPNTFINGWEVTAGRHRFEAVKILGYKNIPCIVVDEDDLHAELSMIDENLCRAELSPADRARCVARRKEIFDELRTGASTDKHVDAQPPASAPAPPAPPTGTAPAVAQAAPPAPKRRGRPPAQQKSGTPPVASPAAPAGTPAKDGDEETLAIDDGIAMPEADEAFDIEEDVPTPADKEFVEKTAAETGRSETSIRTDIKRGEFIAKDVLEKIAGTHLDKGNYLDELRNLSQEDQRKKVEKDLGTGPSQRKKRTDNHIRNSAIRKLASLLHRFVPEAEHDSVESLIEDSDIERLCIEWNKIRYGDK